MNHGLNQHCAISTAAACCVVLARFEFAYNLSENRSPSSEDLKICKKCPNSRIF